jgi:cell division protein FtsB
LTFLSITLLFPEWSGIATQAAADKTSLKAQLDDLAAENSGLKAKSVELADEVAQLKAESTKAQELARMRRVEAETREKDMQQRLQSSLDALRGESSTSSKLDLVPKGPIVDLAGCFFL